MLNKKTIIDQIEIARHGSINIRLALIVEDDGIEISKRWHRVSIDPGMDVDAVLNIVDADIATRDTLKAATIDRGERVALLKSVVGLVHTPQAIAAHRARASVVK